MGFVGDGAPIPVSSGSFTTLTLGYALLGGLSVITKELALLSDPSAERVIRDDLVNASVAAQDAALISAQPAVSACRLRYCLPASRAFPAPGSTAALIAADFNTALQQIATAGVTLRQPVVVMSPAAAAFLSTLRDTAGGTAFPNITVNGGTLFGMPVLTSQRYRIR